MKYQTFPLNVSLKRQKGASLVVVLLLLLVMTILGVFALRGTLMGERMSSNVRDRSLAFQAAESALREAEQAIFVAADAGGAIGFNCDSSGIICPTVPENAYTGNAGCDTSGQNCWTNAANSNLANYAGIPQYYIEFMGERTSVDELGLSDSANEAQYGGAGGVPMASYYRVTARSNDPSIVEDRAVVVLQATVVAHD